MQYTPGYGSYDAKLMILMESPDYTMGNVFQKLCKDNNINLSEHFVNYLFKYPIPLGHFSRLNQVGLDYDECVNELWNEINQIKPNCILAIGAESARAVLGYPIKISQWRGTICMAKDGITKVVIAQYPSTIVRGKQAEKVGVKLNYTALAYTALDYLRAVEESEWRKLELPVRQLEIAYNSAHAYRFFEYYKNKHIASIDVEVNKTIPQCLAFAFNKHHAMSFPLNPDIFPNLPMEEYIEIWKMVAYNLYRLLEIIGQNFKFDHNKIERPLGMYLNPNVIIHDTLLRSRMLYPEFPASQQFLTSVCTREPYYKDEYKEFNPAKDTYERVMLYNDKDVAVDYEIYEDQERDIDSRGLREFYNNFIIHLHPLYREIENTGIEIDFKKRRELRKKYTERLMKVQNRLDEVAERHVNTNAPQQVRKFCIEFLQLPTRAKYDEDTLTALIQNTIGDTQKHQWKKQPLKDILEIRKLRRTIANNLKARPDFDGRMKCSWRILGTETLRSSNTLLEAPDRPVEIGQTLQTVTKHGEVGPDIRSMMIADTVPVPEFPDSKCVLFQIDLAQAEPRIVALLSEDYNLLEDMNKGLDVHSQLAAFIAGKEWDGNRVPDDQRFLGKTGRNAFNYRVGKGTFSITANTDAVKFGIPLELSEWRAGQVLEKIGMRHPNVTNIFQDQIIKALKDGYGGTERRELRNPFGWTRRFYDRYSDKLEREGFAHIPQSTVRCKNTLTMIAFKKAYKWAKIAIEAHDAFLVCNMPEKMVDECKEFCQEFIKRPLNFSRCTLSRDYDLILKGDCEIGYNYKDLEKVKSKK